MAKNEYVKVEKDEKKPVLIDWTYIWVAGDGSIRSAHYISLGETPKIQRFDGSACKQASTDNADLFLVPVRTIRDLGGEEITHDRGIALCEVQTADGTPHASNTRADLRKFLAANDLTAVKIGFEQDALLIDPDTRQPYRWPTGKNEKGEPQVVFPGPQGRYYGGSGDFQRGRELVDSFYNLCVWRKIGMHSYNAAICLSQWSFVTKETDALTACDNLIISRYLLESTAEENSYWNRNTPRCVISYQPKSFPGTEWNGNGCCIRLYLDNYTNSNGNAGLAKAICESIGEDHREHIAAYGVGNEQRLVGKTGGISDFNKFSWGFGDRTASLCVPTIPLNADSAHLLYIEDRRPGGNVDPYAGVLALSRSLTKVTDLAPTANCEAFEPKLVK